LIGGCVVTGPAGSTSCCRHRADFRRQFTDHNGRWKPLSADGIELFNLGTVPVTRYRYRGNQIPTPWALTPV